MKPLVGPHTGQHKIAICTFWILNDLTRKYSVPMTKGEANVGYAKTNITSEHDQSFHASYVELTGR